MGTVFDNHKAHILTRLGVHVGPVLMDAAQDHFNVTGVPIDSFFLPTWMFCKLSRELEFKQSSVSSMGYFNGRIVFRCDRLIEPVMREKNDDFNYAVFYDRPLRTQP